MFDKDSKPWTRRRFHRAGIAALAIGGTTLGSYGFWRQRGESAYRAEVDSIRRALDDSETTRTGGILEAMVRYAVLAPNSHNTQPWLFEGTNASLIIRPDFSRRCSVVDPDDHHLWVSLGCAGENAVLCGEALGRDCEVSFEASRLSLMMENRSPNRSELFEAIPFRQTTRAPFDGRKLSAAELADLQSSCRTDNVEVLFYTEAGDMQKIEKFVVEGNKLQMNDPGFVRELKDWIRFSYWDAVGSCDGLFGKCSNQAVLPNWLGRKLIDTVFTVEAETAKYRSQLRSSAGVAVFVAKEESPAGWIEVGRCFERFALKATAMGVLHSHINQPVEVPEVRSAFIEWLGLGLRRPDLVVRFGRGNRLPYSLRRPVRAVFSERASLSSTSRLHVSNTV